MSFLIKNMVELTIINIDNYKMFHRITYPKTLNDNTLIHVNFLISYSLYIWYPNFLNFPYTYSVSYCICILCMYLYVCLIKFIYSFFHIHVVATPYIIKISHTTMSGSYRACNLYLCHASWVLSDCLSHWYIVTWTSNWFMNAADS